MAFTTGLNNYNTTKYLVNPIAGLGTHTTIGAALTSASSGDDIYIMPATYTENLTLKAGVNLISYNTDSLGGTVTIIGKLSASFSGTCNITGIRLQTNSAFLLELTGANATIVNISNCYLNCTNATGISSTGSNSSAKVNVYDSYGDLGTTGIALFAFTNGSMSLYRFVLNNSGGSVTANTISGNTASINYSYLGNGITTSGSTAYLVVRNCFFDVGNATPITSNATPAGVQTTLFDSYFSCGNATPFVVGASSIIQCTGCTTFSSNAACVTGSGQFNYGTLVQANTKGTLSATTLQAFGTLGNQTSTSPSAGYIGEVISTNVLVGSAVTLTTSTNANVMSMSLTPGIWDACCVTMFNGTVTGTIYQTSISSTSLTSGTKGINFVEGSSATSPTALADTTLIIPPFRIPLSATTTIYVVVAAAFTVGTCKAYGSLKATRVG